MRAANALSMPKQAGSENKARLPLEKRRRFRSFEIRNLLIKSLLIAYRSHVGSIDIGKSRSDIEKNVSSNKLVFHAIS